MDIFTGMDESLVQWVLVPLMIFIARILDVSVGTIRIIFVSKGYRMIAPILGFFEVLIWIVAMGQIMQNLDNFYYYIAYALGFAFGTYIGMLIEDKLSIGMVIVRIITRYDATALQEHLMEQNYQLTSLQGEGLFGDVKVIFMVMPRQKLGGLIRIIKDYNPHAFYSVEDVRLVKEGAFPRAPNPTLRNTYPLRKIFAQRK
ncbi:MAG: DUF2179 domain-containing protein [Candidatus Kapaibacterium sp.]